MLNIFFQVPTDSEPVTMMEENEKEHKEEKAVTGGEREAFVFQEGTRVYEYVSDPEGYQCPMCQKVFSQLGLHISKSECGKDIDTNKFTSDLKKYLKVQNKRKLKAEDPAKFRKKAAELEQKSRSMKMDQNSEECRRKEAERNKKKRDKQMAENPGECRKKQAKNQERSHVKVKSVTNILYPVLRAILSDHPQV